MYTNNSSIISGISVCVPKNEINNYSFLKKDGADQFIKHTGVKKHFLSSNNKLSTSDLCYVAAERIIKKLNWKKKDISFLIFVSQTRDFLLPSTACILQNRLGLSKNILAYDIPLGCSGFVYGLYNSYLISVNMKSKGLLLAGDMSSKLINLNDEKMAGLFGDAGTATAIQHEKKSKKLSFFTFGTDGNGYKNLIYNSSGINDTNKKKYLEMDGAKIFEFVLDEVPVQIKKLLSKSKNSINSIDYFVFHQANKFMLNALGKKLGLPKEKVIYSIDRFGNTNSASIPITLSENLKKKNDLKILISGFGVGYSWASAIINLHKPKFDSLQKI